MVSDLGLVEDWVDKTTKLLDEINLGDFINTNGEALKENNAYLDLLEVMSDIYGEKG